VRRPAAPEKPLDGERHRYTSKDLVRLFGVSRTLIRLLARAGHISPQKQAGKLSYSFQDLLVLRTAAALRAARMRPRKITEALDAIRSALPGRANLGGVPIAAQGAGIVVRERGRIWDARSGQFALALDIESMPASATSLQAEDRSASQASGAAHDHFDVALALEDVDSVRAEAEYEKALRIDVHHMEARINLGRLAHLHGNLPKAETIYREAKDGHALLAFNLAVLLEDMKRYAEAIAAYRDAIAMDPTLADAYFNLARLHEIANEPQAALRHLLTYRRLTKGLGES
jgi:tetratricopeptide (TPR) repeat protein